MEEWFGWAGKILDINLTDRKISVHPLDRDLVLRFIGGRGINTWLLFSLVPPGTDPLGPDNVLIFGTGPLTGTLGPTGRFNVTSLSPMTGILGDGNSGGHWGPELKYAGYDFLILRGKADKPVYIEIRDDKIFIRDADDIWGLNVWEATAAIKHKMGDPEAQVLAIGQAGERQVRYASIMCSLTRAQGRCGNGAVMGSKNVKAIAVKGSKGISVADPTGLLREFQKIYEKITLSPKFAFYPRYGTPLLIEGLHPCGLLPVFNYQQTQMEGIEKIGGIEFIKKYAKKSRACFGCFLHCDHYYHVPDGKYKGTQGPGLEYESIASFGPRLGNLDFGSILFMHNLVAQYGLDSISTGSSISLAIDLFEKGILTKADTDGVELRWGDTDLLVNLIHKIARREGIGDLLAEGPYWMSRRIGRGAEKYVYHMKKLDPSVLEVRGHKAIALAFLTSTRGGDHLRGQPSVEIGGFRGVKPETVIERFGSADVVKPGVYDSVGKPRAVMWYQHFAAVVDAIEICKFSTFWSEYPVEFEDFSQLLWLTTGVRFSVNDLITIGERIWNVEKAFNLRLGLGREDDLPCEKLQNELIADGPCQGERLHLDEFNNMLDAYYALRGWDKHSGKPKRCKLEELGLGDVADDLARYGQLVEEQ
ncbi:MAG: aldehyde ferredoxin oxidoreductase family protein [Eubacteriales bacterium]